MTRPMPMLDLGKRTGPLLVFGGVYSNLQALEAMQMVAKKENISKENILCTGDIVAYCAQPEECVQLIRNWGIASIAGNVEIQLSTGQEDCACDFTDGGRCDTFSRQWYPFAQANLSEASIEWMKDLPEFIRLEYAGKKVVVLHGSLHHTSAFIFESTDWSVKQKNFIDADADLILAGHCGLPFSQEQDGKFWLNPGVIGMPANDASTRVWYMILEEKEGAISYRHVALTYDFMQASDLMKAQKLPFTYAETLKTGIWDNCEILPERETRAQGQELIF